MSAPPAGIRGGDEGRELRDVDGGAEELGVCSEGGLDGEVEMAF